MLDQDRQKAILSKIDTIPIHKTLSMEVLSLEDGKSSIKVPRKKEYDGIFKSFNGGYLSTIADASACWAIMTLVGPDIRMATTSFNVTFIAPCLTDVISHAKVIKCGKTLCIVRVEMKDLNDTLVAVADVHYMLLRES